MWAASRSWLIPHNVLNWHISAMVPTQGSIMIESWFPLNSSAIQHSFGLICRPIMKQSRLCELLSHHVHGELLIFHDNIMVFRDVSERVMNFKVRKELAVSSTEREKEWTNKSIWYIWSPGVFPVWIIFLSDIMFRVCICCCSCRVASHCYI